MTFKNPTAYRTLKCAVTALMPAALLAFTSCSSTPATGKVNEPANPAAYASATDFGGEIVTDAATTTATVVSVDHAKRLVVLKRADGSQATYKAAPGAPGFDDIKAGDVVKVSVAEELAVFLGMNSVPVPVQNPPGCASVCRAARKPSPPKWRHWCLPPRSRPSMPGITP